MGLSTFFFLILAISIGIFSFLLLALNKEVINLDLLFLELDLQLGYIILSSALLGIMVSIVLEVIFFSSKRKNKDE